MTPLIKTIVRDEALQRALDRQQRWYETHARVKASQPASAFASQAPSSPSCDRKSL